MIVGYGTLILEFGQSSSDLESGIEKPRSEQKLARAHDMFVNTVSWLTCVIVFSRAIQQSLVLIRVNHPLSLVH